MHCHGRCDGWDRFESDQFLISRLDDPELQYQRPLTILRKYVHPFHAKVVVAGGIDLSNLSRQGSSRYYSPRVRLTEDGHVVVCVCEYNVCMDCATIDLALLEARCGYAHAVQGVLLPSFKYHSGRWRMISASGRCESVL